MLSERVQSKIVRLFNHRYLGLKSTSQAKLPAPRPGQDYMLYAHVPFCEQLCPYCSFNRYPFSDERARPYFANLRQEMRMLSEMGYDFKSLYIGGGTPTIIVDELCQTIDLARELFSVREVSTETNPNHLVPEVIERLAGKVQRLSVGVQSFDDELLRQMQRFGKYGSGVQTLERIIAVKDAFDSLNVDMIFNFPSQTEDMLVNDLACILESHANQVTFYPLMASPAVSRSLARTVGLVDYRREQHYYQLICDVLTGRKDPPYVFGSAWTFNARNGAAIGVDVGGGAESGLGVGGLGAGAGGAGAGAAVGAVLGAGDVSGAGADSAGGAGASAAAGADGAGTGSAAAATGNGNGNGMIDEYIVDYEEYPAIGSGGLSYLDGALYVNTFSVKDYNKLIEGGRMSIIGRTPFTKWDRMRYRFMMQLFGLRLDKKQWRRDFGCSVARGLPVEYTLFKLVGAIAYEDEDKILLSPKGRYLLVALMREFFIGVNKVRDEARASLDNEERELLFGR